MTSSEIRERIEKSENKIEAKKATIAKKEKWIASGKKDQYEINWLRDDIDRLHSEITETETVIDKYKKQLSGAIEKESIFEKMPEIMKEIEKELCDEWNVSDMARRAKLREEIRKIEEMPVGKERRAARDQFCRDHLGWQIIHQTEDEIKKENARNAHEYVLDLYRRVREVTGEVTDWSGIYANGVALNGIVCGKMGRARVETILAGGYNIQRLHCRTLVHTF